jgi:hypothetical protein
MLNAANLVARKWTKVRFCHFQELITALLKFTGWMSCPIRSRRAQDAIKSQIGARNNDTAFEQKAREMLCNRHALGLEDKIFWKTLESWTPGRPQPYHKAKSFEDNVEDAIARNRERCDEEDVAGVAHMRTRFPAACGTRFTAFPECIPHLSECFEMYKSYIADEAATTRDVKSRQVLTLFNTRSTPMKKLHALR